MSLSLKSKILLPTLAVVAIGSVAISVLSYSNSRAMLTDLTKEQMQQLANGLTTQMESWLSDRMNDVENWSNTKVFQSATQDSFLGRAARVAANVELSRLVNKYPYYERLNVSNTNGVYIACSDSNLVDKLSIADRKYFQDAMNGKSTFSDVIKSKVSDSPVLIVACPIRENGIVTGVLSGVVGLQYLNTRFISPVKIAGSGYAYVCQPDGMILAHKNAKHVMNLNISQYDWGKDFLRRDSGEIEYEFEGVTKMVAVKKCALNDWRVGVSAPLSELLAPARKLGWLTLSIGTLVLVLTILIVVFGLRRTLSPIHDTIVQLNNNANHTTDSAHHLSQASTSLADGASEQAASLEETSSSLEEMSSMTRNNADNAQRAKTLANEARHAADIGSGDMQAMIQAMNEIKASSDNIAKIIKTIDEIAFQTNLLALNAAVEAARAGEAGMGFAVVADEVRNLAQRSAQAAKDTAAMIESAISKAGQGVQISDKVSNALQSIVDKVRKVDELVAAVATASSEQNQGLAQINIAMTKMDAVTQTNAGNAEECASVAQELNSQAQELRQCLADLNAVIYGSSADIQTTALAATPADAAPGASNGAGHLAAKAKSSPKASDKRSISDRAFIKS